jgi:nucleoside-diphosphate-sugar epimerase
MTEDLMLDPETFYGAAKAAGTHLAQVWAKRTGLPVIVFRPASITGVGEQSVHLIPTLIRSCLFKETIAFVGEPVHDYINVRDVCSALEVLASHAKEHKGEIFNVGSGVQISNLQVKEMIESITKARANINVNAKINPLNLSQVWIADNTKLKSLGWQPKVDLFNSLKEMVRAI